MRLRLKIVYTGSVLSFDLFRTSDRGNKVVRRILGYYQETTLFRSHVGSCNKEIGSNVRPQIDHRLDFLVIRVGCKL